MILDENYVQPEYNSIVEIKEIDKYKIYLSQRLFRDRFVGFKEFWQKIFRVLRAIILQSFRVQRLQSSEVRLFGDKTTRKSMTTV